MNVKRFVVALAVVPLALTAVVLPLVSPSQAVAKNLLVSNSADGPFRDHLSTPLFKGEGPFVPHDRAHNTFYVKNNSNDTARATLAVVNHGASSGFENALRFDVDIEGAKATGSSAGRR